MVLLVGKLKMFVQGIAARLMRILFGRRTRRKQKKKHNSNFFRMTKLVATITVKWPPNLPS
jgi:hypothetical protein